MGALKPCGRCGRMLRLDRFYRSRASRDGRTHICRDCSNAANRQWREANRDRRAEYRRRYAEANHAELARRGRRTQLRSRFGLSPEQYEAILELQGRACAICGGDNRSKALCVDHDHRSGIVRGLLCHRCNTVIGFARDSAPRLRAAAAYIRRGGFSSC